MSFIKGLGVALVTPFDKKGDVDFSSLEKLVSYNISSGVDYLVVLGTTAESATLSFDEKKEIIKHISFVNKNAVPMVIGLGGNDTRAIIESFNRFDLNGFSAILSVSPYYNKPSQEGIYQHYKRLSENSPLPLILYNVPGRTSSNISIDTILRLVNNFNNIVAIKQATSDFSQYLDLLASKPENFDVISGDDNYAISSILAGGSGVISVIGNALPEVFSKAVKYALKGHCKEAYQISHKFKDVISLIFKEGNPSGIKALLSLKGICQPYTRLPLVPASKGLIEELRESLNFL